MLYKFILLATSLLLSQLLFSHAGGLNSEGCHNEKKTGESHCHRLNKSTSKLRLTSNKDIYDRDDFNYRSYKSITLLGFYTGLACESVDIDHVVSLKDAHESGAYQWSISLKTAFANDRANHVPSCSGVNRSKGSERPKNFLIRSKDGKGVDYKIIDVCGYVAKYHFVKVKYDLSFASNEKNIFKQCGLYI